MRDRNLASTQLLSRMLALCSGSRGNQDGTECRAAPRRNPRPAHLFISVCSACMAPAELSSRGRRAPAGVAVLARKRPIFEREVARGEYDAVSCAYSARSKLVVHDGAPARQHEALPNSRQSVHCTRHENADLLPPFWVVCWRIQPSRATMNPIAVSWGASTPARSPLAVRRRSSRG